jgi:SnoaL-like domain
VDRQHSAFYIVRHLSIQPATRNDFFDARTSSMPDNAMVRELFDRWEQVWHDGRYDLIPTCLGSNYIRHDEQGDRTVTREAYATELAAIRQERPGIRVVVYDHSFTDTRAWFRFSFKWPDPKSGEPRSRSGIQSYRIEDGKLAETWIALQPLGSAWSDPVSQERWTSSSPISA